MYLLKITYILFLFFEAWQDVNAMLCFECGDTTLSCLAPSQSTTPSVDCGNKTCRVKAVISPGTPGKILPTSTQLLVSALH